MKSFLTKDGVDNLKKEKEELVIKRPEVVATLKKAREMGDLSENGFYKAAKFELMNLDRRVREITRMLQDSQTIQKFQVNFITLGSVVSLTSDKKNMTYEIVGEYEANPSKSRISHVSPLGSMLLGKRIDEQVVIKTPSGSTAYTIVKIA